MKKRLIIFFGLFLIMLPFTNAQWQPDFRLTNSAGFSTNSSIASNENYLHVVWQDTRDGGNNEIYYKRSSNDGVSWENDVRLTNNLGSSLLPSVAVSGIYVYVVWNDNVDGNSEIYFKRSTDNGTSWGDNIRMTNDINVSEYAKISASGSMVQLIWRDVSNGFFELFHKSSNDYGLTWSNGIALTVHSSGLPTSPSILTTDLVVHLVWSDSREGNPEIYYKRSTDGGETWEAETRLTFSSGVSEVPSITSSNSNVHIAWLDLRDGNNEIYYCRSTDSGVSWGSKKRLTNGVLWSQNPCIVSSGTNVHVIWQYGSSNFEIFYKHSTDNGLIWLDSIQISNSLSIARNAVITAVNLSTHVLWTDTRHGSTNWEIYYKRNPTGNVLGVNYQEIELDKNYVLFQNYPNPFNPNTTISWQSPLGSWQTLKVYDVLGNEVATLVDEYREAGVHEIDLDASKLVSGVYFYKLQAGAFSETKKMMLLR